MRQQENLNLHDYCQRYERFAKLPLPQQMWLAELFLHLRDLCEGSVAQLSELTAATYEKLLEDLRLSIEHSHGVESYLQAALFEKHRKGELLAFGYHHSNVMSDLINAEMCALVDKIFAAHVTARFYKNLQDKPVLATRVASSSQFFMAVRRSRSNSNGDLDAWIEQVRLQVGHGVAAELSKNRDNLLTDYLRVLQQQAAACHQAKPPERGAVQPVAATDEQQSEEEIFALVL